MHTFRSRRQFIQRSLSFSTAAWLTPGVFAEELLLTPRQTEGPFYPDRLPLDTDNDLIVVNDNLTPAVGKITHLSGRVLDRHGNPVRNAVVEIWQADSNGSYIHSRSANRGNYDTNFQGFGRFLTDSKGKYYFRTIKPVAYAGRTPHIHFAINRGDKRVLTTQMYNKAEPRNERDGVLRSIRDPKLRELVLVDFKPLEDSKANELTAQFDIILGITPDA